VHGASAAPVTARVVLTNTLRYKPQRQWRRARDVWRLSTGRRGRPGTQPDQLQGRRDMVPKLVLAASVREHAGLGGIAPRAMISSSHQSGHVARGARRRPIAQARHCRRQCDVFETGQGSALSAGAHQVDQQTCEVRAYSVARAYQPLLVNSVVGFIGPEYLYDSKQIIRAGLEDHFCGKLFGLPLGVDICYTIHAEADQDDMHVLLTLLAAAGVAFLMGVPGADDAMLNYQSTSFHDAALYARPAWVEAGAGIRGLAAAHRPRGCQPSYCRRRRPAARSCCPIFLPA
jgi:hypothetical protein